MPETTEFMAQAGMTLLMAVPVPMKSITPMLLAA